MLLVSHCRYICSISCDHAEACNTLSLGLLVVVQSHDVSTYRIPRCVSINIFRSILPWSDNHENNAMDQLLVNTFTTSTSVYSNVRRGKSASSTSTLFNGFYLQYSSRSLIEKARLKLSGSRQHSSFVLNFLVLSFGSSSILCKTIQRAEARFNLSTFDPWFNKVSVAQNLMYPAL